MADILWNLQPLSEKMDRARVSYNTDGEAFWLKFHMDGVGMVKFQVSKEEAKELEEALHSFLYSTKQ